MAISLAAATGMAWAGREKLMGCAETPDRLTAWQARWDANQTSWHIQDPNLFLRRYLRELLPAEAQTVPGMGPRVLVPLCGKTVDMAFLARGGFRVVGVDGVKKALDEFAEEHAVTLPSGGKTMLVNLPPAIDPQLFHASAVLISAHPDEPVRTQAAPPVLLVQGDFLKLGPGEAEALVPFDAAFDRGGLVAVAPADRVQYANVMAGLIAPGGRVLLVVCEHEPFHGGKLGPPFQLTESEVHELFASNFDIKLACREDTIDEPPGGMRGRGVDHFYECVYMLTRRSPKL